MFCEFTAPVFFSTEFLFFEIDNIRGERTSFLTGAIIGCIGG